MTELAAEQKYVNALYARLDALRDEATAALARGHTAPVWRAELKRLAAVEDGLCFGRLDLAGGRGVYIGRTSLFDGEDPLLVDWRAPVARPFYTATAAAPGDVVRRRRITTRGRTVVALDDELLDMSAAGDGLVGEAALLAAVTAERTGRMRDIVTTLQTEQDQIIRDDHRGVLVVQGGPGTGKTAVALHRVAYLLYSHEHLRTRGVLVVGPSRVFLDYIGQVLPGLGENRVVTATLPDLYPVAVSRVDPPSVAAWKGSALMADRLAAAVRARVRTPTSAVYVEFEEQELRLDPATCRWAARKARRTGLPHNQARLVFQREVVGALVGELVDRMEAVVFSETGESLDGGSADGRLSAADLKALGAAGVVLGPEDEGPRTVLDEADRAALHAAVLADDGVTAVLDELWPPLVPAEVVAEFLTADAAVDEVDGQVRDGRGGVELSALGEARGEAGGQAHEGRRGVDAVDEIAGRVREGRRAGDVLSPAEAASGAVRESEVGAQRVPGGEDRAGQWSAADIPLLDEVAVLVGEGVPVFGHVVVDEAQEISEMGWRMLARRCPTKSMTIVGDLAQTGSEAGAADWERVPRPQRLAQLTVNYRTPAEIMDVASEVLVAHHPGLRPPRSVRATGQRPWRWRVDDLDAALAELVAAHTGGQLAIIASDTDALGLGLPVADLTGTVVLLTPTAAKGLEFDVVIIVEPASILAGVLGHNDLYVAMTRATQELGVVHTEALPEALTQLKVR